MTGTRLSANAFREAADVDADAAGVAAAAAKRSCRNRFRTLSIGTRRFGWPTAGYRKGCYRSSAEAFRRGSSSILRSGAADRRVGGLHGSLWLSLSSLNAVLLHGVRPVHAVQFEIKAARVANRLARSVSAPQRRHRRLTITARSAYSPRSGQSPWLLHQGPIHSVHLVVETARVAQVVASTVSPPERSGNCPAIYALAALRKVPRLDLVHCAIFVTCSKWNLSGEMSRENRTNRIRIYRSV